MQEELIYLFRDFALSKNKEELLGSRLQQWYLLQRRCHNFFISKATPAVTELFFRMESNLVYSVPKLRASWICRRNHWTHKNGYYL